MGRMIVLSEVKRTNRLRSSAPVRLPGIDACHLRRHCPLGTVTTSEIGRERRFGKRRPVSKWTETIPERAREKCVKRVCEHSAARCCFHSVFFGLIGSGETTTFCRSNSKLWHRRDPGDQGGLIPQLAFHETNRRLLRIHGSAFDPQSGLLTSQSPTADDR